MEYLVLVDNSGSEINRFNLVDLDKVDYDGDNNGVLVITYKNHAKQFYPAWAVKITLR